MSSKVLGINCFSPSASFSVRHFNHMTFPSKVQNEKEGEERDKKRIPHSGLRYQSSEGRKDCATHNGHDDK